MFLENNDTIQSQKKICLKYGTDYVSSPPNLKVGISSNAKNHVYPINGLRHQPIGDTTGWYIWAGTGGPGKEIDFFLPLHVTHLQEYCPDVIDYLGLPPGWRFLIAPGYVDVWYDENIVIY